MIFPVLLPRLQVFSLLRDGFLLDLRGDWQVPCVCQAPGLPSNKTLSLPQGSGRTENLAEPG